jgi:SPP1 gp7 family putative phage head morphogenesis protein
VGDERVRDEHEGLDGEQFDYDDLPSEGLPGEPIQCRCYAEPVLSAILDDTGDE